MGKQGFTIETSDAKATFVGWLVAASLFAISTAIAVSVLVLTTAVSTGIIVLSSCAGISLVILSTGKAWSWKRLADAEVRRLTDGKD